MKAIFSLSLALVLSGCSAATPVVHVQPTVLQMSNAAKAMDNCERHLENQQRHNNLSPQCYCEWQKDNEFNARRGSFPERYLDEAVVTCQTCDPFQVGGIECGDIGNY